MERARSQILQAIVDNFPKLHQELVVMDSLFVCGVEADTLATFCTSASRLWRLELAVGDEEVCGPLWFGVVLE